MFVVGFLIVLVFFLIFFLVLRLIVYCLLPVIEIYLKKIYECSISYKNLEYNMVQTEKMLPLQVAFLHFHFH